METIMRRRHAPLLLGIATTLTLLLGTVSAAQAQYPPPYGPPPGYGGRPVMYRDGLVIGFGLGFGAMAASNCGDLCGGALPGEFRLGGMANPRMALMADFWGNIRDVPNSDATLTNSLFTGALQYWVNDIIWLKGGIGAAHAQTYSNLVGVVYGDEWGFGVMGAVGIEVVHAS